LITLIIYGEAYRVPHYAGTEPCKTQVVYMRNHIVFREMEQDTKDGIRTSADIPVSVQF
jgi:hypothetical protein